MSELAQRLREHALPDPHDEREVMHAPLLTEAATELDRLTAEVTALRAQFNATPKPADPHLLFRGHGPTEGRAALAAQEPTA